MLTNVSTRVSFLRAAVSLCRVASSLCLGVDVYIIRRLAFPFFDSKFYFFESEYYFSESQVHISRTAVLHVFRRVEHYGILRAAGFSCDALHFVLLYCRVLLKSMADNPINHVVNVLKEAIEQIQKPQSAATASIPSTTVTNISSTAFNETVQRNFR